jgi:Zn-finger nucleic acid-binding protein
MKCPRCETSVLEERERDRVTIDVCQQCRGIWLDRGELEKLIARAVEDSDGLDGRRGFDGDDDQDRRGGRMGQDEQRGLEDRKSPDGRGRKRRWYESLTDIFD